MADERRKWTGAQIDEATWNELRSAAVYHGIRPEGLVEQAIIAWIEQDKEDRKTPPAHLRIYVRHLAVRRKRQERAMLCDIGAEILEGDDREEYDKFITLCEESGYSPEVVIADIKMQRSSPIVVQDNGRGLGSATIWLQDMFKQQQTYPSNVIVVKGHKAGFSKPTLNAAKRQLGILSIRKSSHWIWAHPDYEDNGNHTEAVSAEADSDDPFAPY